MNIRKKEKGITLVALVITIVLLLIIAGISITGSISGNDQVKEEALLSELNMVQHAILERYTKSQLTKESLPGTDVEKESVEDLINQINSSSGESIKLKGTEYKRLSKDDLINLGITNENDTYIVNYKTGEVINEKVKTTKSGKALYIFSKNQE